MPKDVFLGRQPICDSAQEVQAYELLYRGAEQVGTGQTSGEMASATVALNSIIEIGLDRVVGDRLAFINTTRTFIVDGQYRALPPDRIVLEILEDIEPDAEVLSEVRAASELGYRIALDDFIYRESLEPLIELADFVKVELLDQDVDSIREHAKLLRRPGLTIIAEKVETPEQFELCRDAGYDWFQGYFFCRPKLIVEKGLPTDRLSLLRLMARLQDPKTEVDEIAEIVERDVVLSYRLLRYINCALYSLPNRIDSIRQAMTLLGLNRVRSCVTLLLMTQIDDKPREFMVVALVRARMCQLLAASRKHLSGDLFFSVGLLSVLDALMDRPMEELLESIPVSSEITAALLERSGAAGEALQLALACETGDWSEVGALTHSAEVISSSYIEAVSFANEVLTALASD